jgi:hypothetical protein
MLLAKHSRFTNVAGVESQAMTIVRERKEPAQISPKLQYITDTPPEASFGGVYSHRLKPRLHR